MHLNLKCTYPFNCFLYSSFVLLVHDIQLNYCRKTHFVRVSATAFYIELVELVKGLIPLAWTSDLSG